MIDSRVKLNYITSETGCDDTKAIEITGKKRKLDALVVYVPLKTVAWAAIEYEQLMKDVIQSLKILL